MPTATPWATDDVRATASGPDARYARRFSLDVAEEALRKLAPEVLPFVVQRLAERIIHHEAGSVEATVHEYLRNREWAEPIIKEAIRDAVRRHINAMFEATR